LAGAFADLRRVEADTWHLHCAELLGPRYAEEIRKATDAWLPE
jgi:hypothetical protein